MTKMKLGKPKINPITFGEKKIEKFSKGWYDELLTESKPDLIEWIRMFALDIEKVKEKYSELKKYSTALENRIRYLRNNEPNS